MGVSLETLRLRQCCLELPSKYRHEQLGREENAEEQQLVGLTQVSGRIYRPAKTATQSGDWHGHHWRMDWDILQKGHRWENPLMGWQSSADFLQGTHLNFKSREDAVHFAQKQGYEHFVQEPNERRFVPKAYANNFMHNPKKLKKIPTK